MTQDKGKQNLPSMFGFLPCPPHRFNQILLRDFLPARKVPRSNLGINFHSGVGWDKIVWNVITFENGDTGLDDGIIFPE